MSEMEDKVNEINKLGETFSALYARCWSTAFDCYSRNFSNKEKEDRAAITNIANFLFSCCVAALTGHEISTEENGET
jgi:hypothetical protein